MSTELTNKIKFLLASKAIDFANDSFKIILMNTGFVFNKDTHHAYANISAYELATGYGYTQNTKTLTGVSLNEDDSDDRCEITWDNPSWTASGGDIGPTPGAIIFDDTVTSPVADPIVGYIDFGGDQTQVDGGIATIGDVEVRIA